MGTEQQELIAAVRRWYEGTPSEAMKHDDSRRYFCLLDQGGFALAQVCERYFAAGERSDV